MQIATYQFYQKEKITLHLDINSSSFLIEKEQLVEQGFERIGDVMQAENSQLAHKKFRTIQLDELQNFANNNLFAATVDSLSG